MWAEYRDAPTKRALAGAMGAGRWQPLGCASIGFTNPGGSELARSCPIQDMLNRRPGYHREAADAALSYALLWPAWKRR